MAAPSLEAVDGPQNRHALAPAGARARRLWILLLVVGFALRLFTILWGSVHYDPGQFSLHSDEPKLVRYVDDFPESMLENADYRYPTFVHNVCGLAWWGTGTLLGLRDENPSEVGEPSYEGALLLGRALNIVLFGLGGMLLTWAFARKMFGESAALWALGALNLFVWTVTSTALVQPDVAAGVGMLWVFYLLVDVERLRELDGRRGWWLGIALGVAISMKYTAALAALAILFVSVVAWRKGNLRPSQFALFHLRVALAGTLSFCVFVPGAVFDFQDFFDSLRYEFLDKSSGTGAQVPFDKFLEALHDSLPVWMLLPAALGALYAVRRQRSSVSMAILVCAGAYLLVTYRAYKPDYGILFVPYVAVFAGLFADRVARWRPSRWSVALPLAGLVVGHLYTTWAVYQRYAGDTRYRFQEWALENIPPGPIGEGPRAGGRPLWSCPKEPPGYEFVGVHSRPEWIVLNQRDTYTALMAIEQGEKTFYGLKARDLAFYEDVSLGKQRKFRYELALDLQSLGLPVDKQGKWIQVFRRVR